MRRLPACLALVVTIALGCGASAVLDSSTDEEDDVEPESASQLEPRVEDCEREEADAVPLATIRGGDLHLAADEQFLYFTSEDRVLRVSMTDGEPETLVSGRVEPSQVKVEDGFVYWLEEGVIHRMPTRGGEPEPLVKLAPAAIWAVAGQAILSSGTHGEPSPLYRTSLLTGQTTEIPEEDSQQLIQDLGVAGDDAVVVIASGDKVYFIDPCERSDESRLVAMPQ